MASKRKIHNKRIKNKALDDPGFILNGAKRDLPGIIYASIQAVRKKSISYDDKYWEISAIKSRGKRVTETIDILLGEIARLNDCVRDATDEAIQSNIEAKMYKNMLGGRVKDTKINIGKIIKGNKDG